MFMQKENIDVINVKVFKYKLKLTSGSDFESGSIDAIGSGHAVHLWRRGRGVVAARVRVAVRGRRVQVAARRGGARGRPRRAPLGGRRGRPARLALAPARHGVRALAQVQSLAVTHTEDK